MSIKLDLYDLDNVKPLLLENRELSPTAAVDENLDELDLVDPNVNKALDEYQEEDNPLELLEKTIGDIGYYILDELKSLNNSKKAKKAKKDK